MSFKSGKSGNPNGRPKGALNKRTQLAKLLEPHAQALIDKTIELALGGDVNALRLCIERLIPRLTRESIDLCLPKNPTPKQIFKFKAETLQAVFDGKIGVDYAERLIKLMQEQIDAYSRQQLNHFKMPNDPIEAMKVYQQMMRG